FAELDSGILVDHARFDAVELAGEAAVENGDGPVVVPVAVAVGRVAAAFGVEDAGTGTVHALRPEFAIGEAAARADENMGGRGNDIVVALLGQEGRGDQHTGRAAGGVLAD